MPPRKIFRKKRVFRKKNTTTNAAMLKVVKSVLNKRAELKFSTGNAIIAPTYNGTIVDLHAAVAQGDDQNTRDGSVLTNKGLLVSFQWVGNAASATTSQWVRFMVIRCFNELGTAPTVANIIQNLGSAYAIISPKTYNRHTQYKVLFDSRRSLGCGATPGFQNTWMFRRYFPLKDTQTTYSGAATTVNNGGYYLIFLTDTATDPAGCQYITRLTYTDS